MIYCADDYGLHPFVNEAVLELLRSKKINCTTVLINRISHNEAKSLLKVADYKSIGLHLDVGLFQIFRIEHEIALQVRRFEELFGFFPAFIDGHRHCHVYPVVSRALINYLKQRNLPDNFYVRSVVLPRQLLITGAGSAKIYMHVLDSLGRRLQQKMRKIGIKTNPVLWGVFNRHRELAVIHNLAYETAGREDLFFFHPAINNFDSLSRKTEYELVRNFPSF